MLYFLSSPFTHYPRGYKFAAHDIALVSHKLRAKGVKHFSPIVASYRIAIETGVDPLDWRFWMALCEPWYFRCDGLIVAMLDGWDNSKGVSVEIERFSELGKPVRYLDCDAMKLRADVRGIAA